MNLQAPPNLSRGALRAADRRRHQRLGRRLAGDAGSRQSRGAWPRARRARARAPRRPASMLVERLRDLSAPMRASADALARPGVCARRCCALAMPTVLRASDAWAPGADGAGPARPSRCAQRAADARAPICSTARARRRRARRGRDRARSFAARGGDFDAVCRRGRRAARAQIGGDAVSYVVNRNINYTNICYLPLRVLRVLQGQDCSEASARRGPTISTSTKSRGARSEAWERGATEVCLQGGIHPDYTGETYLAICRAVKEAVPEMHVHAFSPLEVCARRGDARPAAWPISSAELKRRRVSARCPAPPPKFSTTRCAPSSAPTSSTTAHGST